MELFLQPGKDYAFLLELIIDYLKLAERNLIKVIHLSPAAIAAVNNGKLQLPVPSLVTAEGGVEVQIFQMCKRLLELMPQWRQFMLGHGEEGDEIWGVKAHLKQGKQLRKHLQKHLESRTFFVGNHITFADFYMFTQLYDNVLEMTDQQKLQYHNLFRWYSHIQNLPQIKEYLLKNKRFLLQPPVAKVPFIAEKKKVKKQKKPEGKKEQKKEEKKEESKQPKKEEKKQQGEKKQAE